MTIRSVAILVGVAVSLGGCVVAPHHYSDRRVDHYDSDYRTTESYQGYYYVRVVYVEGAPWYVDDDGRARPIPPHLHQRFLSAPQVRSAPPSFSRDTTVRYGYPRSRIVYINNEPYHVDDERHVHPLPSHLRGRFPYVAPAAPRYDDGWEDGERPRPPFLNGNTGSRVAPPAYGREQSPPPLAYGREQGQPLPPEAPREDNGRVLPERPMPPFLGGGSESRVEPPAYGRDQGQPVPPAYGRDPQQSPPPANDSAQQTAPPAAAGGDRQESEPLSRGDRGSTNRRSAPRNNGRDGTAVQPAPANNEPRDGEGRGKAKQAGTSSAGRGDPAKQSNGRGKKKQADTDEENEDDSANKNNGRDR